MATTEEIKEPTKEKAKKVEPPFFSIENFKSLGIMIAVILAFRWTVSAPYHVPTPSMSPTIKVGDRLIAWKMAYDIKIPFTNISVLKTGTIKKGDIILFRYPKDPSVDYVKRVVGVAGDQIRVVDDVLYINGEAQEQTSHEQDRSILDDIDENKDLKQLFREKIGNNWHWLIFQIPSARHFATTNWPENGYYTVPEDSVFVMGDNRHNSWDSRSWGRVPLENVHGKALFIFWSMYMSPDETWPIFRFKRFGTMLDSYP